LQKINLIKKLLSGEYSRVELNSFIEFCIKISKTYLILKHYKISKQILHTELDIDDISIEAITPLFLLNEKNEFYNLKKAFDNWDPPVQSDSDALFFLNKIIQNRVEQHIITVLKTSDFQFTKIFNSINYQIRKNDYEKQIIFGTTYIVKKQLKSFDKQFISADEFEKLSFQDFLTNKNLLEGIFKHLEKSKYYSSAIPLNLLIYKIKSLNETEIVKRSIIDEAIEDVSLDDIITQSVKATHSKLISTYFEKKKLSEGEVELFKKTIIDLGDDLKNGGVNRGLFEYLKEHSTRLTREKYAGEYQNILEYLLKTLKNEVKIRLTEK